MLVILFASRDQRGPFAIENEAERTDANIGILRGTGRNRQRRVYRFEIHREVGAVAGGFREAATRVEQAHRKGVARDQAALPPRRSASSP